MLQIIPMTPSTENNSGKQASLFKGVPQIAAVVLIIAMIRGCGVASAQSAAFKSAMAWSNSHFDHSIRKANFAIQMRSQFPIFSLEWHAWDMAYEKHQSRCDILCEFNSYKISRGLIE